MKRNPLVQVTHFKTIKTEEQLRPNYFSVDAKVYLKELDTVRKVYRKKDMTVYFNYIILDK